MYRPLLMGLVFITLIGCAFNAPSLVPPYVLGIKIDISKLKRDLSQYNLYYSGPVYNPSAILFLKKDAKEEIVLGKDYNKIKDSKLFGDLINRIEYLQPDLYALVARNDNMPHVVGYIYTPGTTALKKNKGKEVSLASS